VVQTIQVSHWCRAMIKRQKVDYKLEDSKGRSSRHCNIRVYLIAMCQHADASFEEAKKTNLPSIEQGSKTTKPHNF
jgi:hypothetical protein